MIARLKPATVYMARVSSQNNYGYSHPSETFKFATRGAGMFLYEIDLFGFYYIFKKNYPYYCSFKFFQILF